MRKNIIALAIAVVVCIPLQMGCGPRRVIVHSPGMMAPPANVRVWVNTKTGVYHYPGAANYGRTKNGAFMSERDAQAQGFRPARNNQ